MSSRSLRVEQLFIFLLLLSIWVAANAVDIELIAVENVFDKPPPGEALQPYGIVLGSFPRALQSDKLKPINRIEGELMYQFKIRLNGVIYYRLVLGNFANRRLAQQRLAGVKPIYPDAWIIERGKFETELLAAQMDQKVASKKDSLRAAKLLKQARDDFFAHNYARVISIANKVMEIGETVQQEQALELAGISRERQRKFAQAIALYQQFLDRYPDSKLRPRIESRLQGLRTMGLEPRKKISRKPAELAVRWNTRGTLAQYYRDDRIDRDELDNESVNTALVTDFDIFARRKSAHSSLIIRFDGGVVNDQLENESDSRVSRAMVSYTNNESGYQLSGGRQSRTAAGIYGRFDGLVFNRLSEGIIDYSFYGGYLVQSSFDDVDTSRPFVGTSISFEPYDNYEMDIYLTHQEIDDLVDRQAIGMEVQKRFETGFLYGVLDYDIFFGDLNNVTLISNYRMDDQWIFNLSVDYRNSPLLTTNNAIQGQPVETVKELGNLFSEQQIYDLAEDRTSKSQNLFLGASYQIDNARQLYLSLAYTSIDDTEASGGVDATEASDDIHLSGDYSQRGYLFGDDYSSLGMRLSDTTSAETVSIRLRSRFPGPGGLKYDPRIRLDYRTSKNSEVSQWILNPSIRMNYQYSNKVNFEASLGIEYSNFDLPELDDQTVYSIFAGYTYLF